MVCDYIISQVSGLELGWTLHRMECFTCRNNNNPACGVVHFSCQKINRIHIHTHIYFARATETQLGVEKPGISCPCRWHRNVS